MRRLGAVLAALLLIGVVAGVAYASIPGPDGVINGCRKNSTGDMRVIDSAATCPSGWTALNWSQNGITGYELVTHSETVDIGSTSVDVAAEAFCSTGKKALGGGVAAPGDVSADWAVTRSQPIQDGTVAVGWRAQAHRFGTTPTQVGNLSAYVICATAN